MQMPKPTDEAKQRFRSLVPDAEGVELKPMFGQLAAFVQGNMFAGLFGSTVGVKLAPPEPGSTDQSGPVAGRTREHPSEQGEYGLSRVVFNRTEGHPLDASFSQVPGHLRRL